MKISLNDFKYVGKDKKTVGAQDGYGINKHVIPFIFGHILSGGIYGKRHFDIANDTNSTLVCKGKERFFHRCIGVIECIPVLGTLASAVDALVGGAFSKKTSEETRVSLSTPAPKVDKCIIESPTISNNPITANDKEGDCIKCLKALGFGFANGVHFLAFTFIPKLAKDLELRDPEQKGDVKIYRMYEVSTGNEICEINASKDSSMVTLTEEGIAYVKSKQT